MDGMGRECGIVIASPLCSRRSRYPASMRAEDESGGVLISPLKMTSGLSSGDTDHYAIYGIMVKPMLLTF